MPIFRHIAIISENLGNPDNKTPPPASPRNPQNGSRRRDERSGGSLDIDFENRTGG